MEKDLAFGEHGSGSYRRLCRFLACKNCQSTVDGWIFGNLISSVGGAIILIFSLN